MLITVYIVLKSHFIPINQNLTVFLFWPFFLGRADRAPALAGTGESGARGLGPK
jgi:hypothetical protein